MKSLFGFLFLIGFFAAFSQEKTSSENAPEIKIDSLYREDQFYFSLAINTLQNKPTGLTQDKFSSGFSAGFIRDFPINKNRTIAIAPGIGMAYNIYNQNLKITAWNQVPIYSIIESNVSFDKNKFSQLLIEMPIEFRWRTSTYRSHKFWRVYGGFKMAYLVYDKSVFQDFNGKIVVYNNRDFSKLQYGTYFTVGYNSINIFAYYGLNRLFKNAKNTTETIDMNSVTIGVLFYIL
jgi:hypothetical protein